LGVSSATGTPTHHRRRHETYRLPPSRSTRLAIARYNGAGWTARGRDVRRHVGFMRDIDLDQRGPRRAATGTSDARPSPLHRCTAVPSLPLNRRDSRQRRFWANLPFDRLVCTTSPSASSVLLSSRFEGTTSAVTMPARSLVWSCNSLGHAFTYGHGDERRSWATSLVDCFACTTSQSTSSGPLSSCFEGTVSTVTMLARLHAFVRT